jgi:hypothetical protein
MEKPKKNNIIKKIKIQKNVPMPEWQDHRGRPRLYPWLTMEVGDSFVLEKAMSREQASSYAAAGCRRYSPRRFRTAFHKGEWRVWRVS